MTAEGGDGVSDGDDVCVCVGDADCVCDGVGDSDTVDDAEAPREGVCVGVGDGVGGTHAVMTTLPAVPLAPAATDCVTSVVALKESTCVASANELPPPPPD